MAKRHVPTLPPTPISKLSLREVREYAAASLIKVAAASETDPHTVRMFELGGPSAIANLRCRRSLETEYAKLRDVLFELQAVARRERLG